MPGRAPSHEPETLDDIHVQLAAFRYRLRKFLRFSENAARQAGITPQQHQLMLGIAGFNGTGSATISELAEFLQERHHSVVGLIDRAVLGGLAVRAAAPADRRVVLVSLTARGRAVLRKLSLAHHAEVTRLRDELPILARPTAPRSSPVPPAAAAEGKKTSPAKTPR